MKEEEAEVKRREEEQERRRMARLMEEVNEDNENNDALKPRKRAAFEIDSDGDNISDRDDDRVFQGFDDEDEFDADEDDDPYTCRRDGSLDPKKGKRTHEGVYNKQEFNDKPKRYFTI